MYSAYKRSKFIVSLLFLIGSIPLTSYANECSTLQLIKTEIDGDRYVSRIRLNNGFLLESEKRGYQEAIRLKASKSDFLRGDELSLINGTKLYYLEEGEHNLTVELWKKRDLKRLFNASQVARKILDEPQKISSFKLNVEKNVAYKMAITPDSQIQLTSEKSSCLRNNSNLLSALTKKVESNPMLPEKLEKRLRVVMNKLFDSGTSLGVISRQVSQYFGAVPDNNFKGRKGEIRLLSVLPFSLAHNIGLLSGDVIVSYGDPKYNTLEKLLASVEYKKEIQLKVLRNNALVELNMIYEPVVIPEVAYSRDHKDMQKTLIGAVEFNRELQFEYEWLLLEISEYYRNNNYKGRLNIVRDNEVSNQFGLMGTLNKRSNSQYTITVDEVLPYSAANAIGVEVGDIILSVNNKRMNTRDLSHISRVLKKLQIDESYTIEIERGNNKIILYGDFKPSILSRFKLQIQLDTKEAYYANISFLKNINDAFDELEGTYKGTIKVMSKSRHTAIFNKSRISVK